MNLNITPEVLDDFLSITGSDIRNFFINYSIFYQDDYSEIVNFYKGASKDISKDVFKNFISLKTELDDILNKFQQFNKQLENVKFIELLNTTEECNDALQTLNNISKWSRSSVDIFGYNSKLKKKYVISQNNTLETIATNVLSSDDPQNDWYNIAIENNLTEDDYNSEGGNVLNITIDNSGFSNTDITSVVDIIKDKSIFGRDIDRDLHFNNNDIAYLNEDDTIAQAVNILCTLRKRDNLDFLNNGLQSNLIVGQNKSLFNFPIVERQMQDTFRNDDTLKNFVLKQFKFQEDNVYIEFQIENRLNEIMELSINL